MLPLLLIAQLAGSPPCPDSSRAAGGDSLCIIRFSADSPPTIPPGATHFSMFRVDSVGLVRILRDWHAVSEDAWLHEYSHVGFGDRTGTAMLAGGVTIRWLVRPGGLAMIDYPDGRRVHLVACVTGHRPG
jgi:hypothetical protein